MPLAFRCGTNTLRTVENILSNSSLNYSPIGCPSMQSMSFDLIEFSNNCKLVEKYELTGYSHDVIDVEIWKKLS